MSDDNSLVISISPTVACLVSYQLRSVYAKAYLIPVALCAQLS